jgi:hypothetical protein
MMPRSFEEILFSLSTGTLGKEGMHEFRLYERDHTWDRPPSGVEIAEYVKHLSEHLWKPVQADPMLIHEWTPETLLVTYFPVAHQRRDPNRPYLCATEGRSIAEPRSFRKDTILKRSNAWKDAASQRR